MRSAPNLSNSELLLFTGVTGLAADSPALGVKRAALERAKGATEGGLEAPSGVGGIMVGMEERWRAAGDVGVGD